MSIETSPTPGTENQGERQPEAGTPVLEQVPGRMSSRGVIMAGILLIGLFFSPFVSCADAQFSGAKAFQESLSSQEISGISLILFPLAGFIGIVMGLIALRRITSGRSVQGQGNLVLLATLATGWPIFEAIRYIIRAEGAMRLEWGFYASVLASVGMLVGSLGMRKGPKKQG